MVLKVRPRPAVPESSRHLSEMQVPRPHPEVTDAETLAVRPLSLCMYKCSRPFSSEVWEPLVSWEEHQTSFLRVRLLKPAAISPRWASVTWSLEWEVGLNQTSSEISSSSGILWFWSQSSCIRQHFLSDHTLKNKQRENNFVFIISKVAHYCCTKWKQARWRNLEPSRISVSRDVLLCCALPVLFFLNVNAHVYILRSFSIRLLGVCPVPDIVWGPVDTQ